jgi:colanic acid biosynthesis glycosyl transferase WcaI
LNILIVSQYFWPENFRINDLAAELSKRDHQVTVLTAYPNYPDGHIFPEFRRNRQAFSAYAGVEIIRVPIVPRGSRALSLIANYASFVISASLLGAWRLRGRQFDVIFVFEISPITVGLPAALLRWLKRAPIIFWVLDLWPDALSAVGAVRSPRILAVVGRVVTFIYARCDLILAQSKGFVSEIKKYCAAGARIQYFPSWAEEIYQGERSEIAPEVESRPDMFTILFAGNIGVMQDFPSIIETAELLRHRKNIRWLILGDGRQGDWLRGEVDRCGLQDVVLLPGRYPIERMPSFYSHADALLVSLKPDPVLSMTIPGKVQSYLTAGIPILGMLDGEGARVIQEAGAGLVCPAGDAAGLANAIVEMSSMTREKRAEMGAKGQLYAKNEFDRPMLLDRVESWMLELAGSASLSAAKGTAK